MGPILMNWRVGGSYSTLLVGTVGPIFNSLGGSLVNCQPVCKSVRAQTADITSASAMVISVFPQVSPHLLPFGL